MVKHALLAIALVAAVSLAGIRDANAGFNIGGGLHYLYALGDIDEDNPDLNKNAFGIIGSVQFAGPMLKLEGNIEYIFNYLGSDLAMWEPSAYVLLGGLIYGGAGIGVSKLDEAENWSDPWYALRGGVNLPLGGMGLDLYATYRFWSDDDLEDLTGDDLDSITFAAVLRFGM